jgi:hypothetical protein
VPFPAPPVLFDIKTVVTDLIRAHDYHEGLYDISIEFSIGVGSFGPTQDQALPGAMLGISKIGLQPTSVVGPHTVNAAEVNPPAAKGRKSKSS